MKLYFGYIGLSPIVPINVWMLRIWASYLVRLEDNLFNPGCPLLVISTNITAFYICNFFFSHCINFIFNVERVYSVAKLLLISTDLLFGSLKWYVCICRNCVVETTNIGLSATFLALKMRPTKICEEEIEKMLAMLDEDEEDFSISESEFETNLLEEGMNSSEDDSSDNSEDWNEEPPPQAPQDNIIPFSKRFLRGKNKYKWATIKGKRRRSAINIVHHARGPTGAAKNVTDCAEVFKLFITDEILSIIVHYTNIEIEKRNGDFPTEKPVNKKEKQKKNLFYLSLQKTPNDEECMLKMHETCMW